MNFVHLPYLSSLDQWCRLLPGVKKITLLHKVSRTKIEISRFIVREIHSKIYHAQDALASIKILDVLGFFKAIYLSGALNLKPDLLKKKTNKKKQEKKTLFSK